MSSPPTTLGQYQIIREIARSNDIVYEAYDPLMNRRVAVKELAMPTGMTDAQKADRISRFKREAQAAGTLNHANIMTVYSFAEEAGRIFMALEFLDGHTLRNEIDTKGFIPVDRAVGIAIEILEGLGHAHSKGVIHRDIKPDNIQILSSGQVKITDFGIARLTFQPNLTMDGQVFGTPSYMSPEQVVGRDIDARSDLFSVAVVLYEMISGQKPFPGDSVVTITYAIMNKEPQQPSQCTWSLWQVLSRALDKSPQLRYAGAEDMVEALRDAERQAKSGTMSSPAPMGQTGAYAPLAPPPQLSPYAQAPSPYPTAYNPYQPQAPHVQQSPYAYGQQNPYMTPYQPGQYQQNQYQQMPSMQPPGVIPIYYPPPPRQPFMKPETVIFFRRVAVTFLIVGTLFLLVFIMLGAAVKYFDHGTAKLQDTAAATEIAQMDPKIPIKQRVERAEQIFRQLPEQGRFETAHNVAVLYEEFGKQQWAEGDKTNAENSFLTGTERDATDAALWSDLGGLYDSEALNEADASMRAKLLTQAGNAWNRATAETRDVKLRMQYGDGAAKDLMAAATLLRGQPGADASMIRGLLYDAKAAAPPDSFNLRSEIDRLLAEVNG